MLSPLNFHCFIEPKIWALLIQKGKDHLNKRHPFIFSSHAMSFNTIESVWALADFDPTRVAATKSHKLRAEIALTRKDM